MQDSQKTQGVPFFNLRSGETHYAKLEPQIQAFINSSDMGINASRGQDFKWRLAPEWVKKIKEFRRDETKMGMLTARNGGQQITTPQILYAIYGEQVRAAADRADEEATPYEAQYQKEIADEPKAPKAEEPEDVPIDVDEADLEPASKPTKVATAKQK